MQTRSGLILLLVAQLLLAACAAQPKHFPSETAARYVGKPLNELEMHWSIPWNESSADGRQSATWRFDQYNLAGCTVTVSTDANGIIRHVEWTVGCGPKGTGTGEGGGFDSP